MVGQSCQDRQCGFTLHGHWVWPRLQSLADAVYIHLLTEKATCCFQSPFKTGESERSPVHTRDSLLGLQPSENRPKAELCLACLKRLLRASYLSFLSTAIQTIDLLQTAGPVRKAKYLEEGQQNHLRLRVGSAFSRAGLKIKSSGVSATFDLANCQGLPVKHQLSTKSNVP